MAVQDKINTNREKYDSLNAMLKSDNKEDFNTAIAILENIDFKENAALFLLLRKYHKNYTRFWPKKIEEKIASYVNSNYIEFNNIFNALINNKAPRDQVQLFLDIYAEELKSTLIGLNYGFVEFLDFKINLKDEK